MLKVPTPLHCPGYDFLLLLSKNHWLGYKRAYQLRFDQFLVVILCRNYRAELVSYTECEGMWGVTLLQFKRESGGVMWH